MSNPKTLVDLQQKILREMKNLLDRVPLEISARTGDFLMSPSYKVGLVVSKKTGNRYYNRPNDGNRLRVLYGNIQRAITLGKTGNYSSTSYKNGHFLVEFGYDPSTKVNAGTRTTTLEYAQINEETRPFLEPGFSGYFDDPSGWDELRQEMEDRIVQLIRDAVIA